MFKTFAFKRFNTYTNCVSGLQTPRLKRLAEIVSAQAIAQQEKLENPLDEDLTDSELNGS